jgi:hypothetical protein
MMKKFLFIGAIVVLFTGCASVPVNDSISSNQVKQITTPSDGQAGLYVYRTKSPVGAALKKDIWVDGKCLGESARGVFFYQEVIGDREHTIATESEFSPNILTLNTVSGKNYFVQQYIKAGIVVGGANLKVVDEQTAKAAIQNLSLAQAGTCSKPIQP